MGELFSVAAALTPTLIHPDRIAVSINSCVGLIAKGNAAEFARQLHLEQAEVQRWQQRSTIPQLETLLWICARLEISLLQFFMGDLEEASVNQMLSREQAPIFSKKHRKHSCFEHESAKQALEAIIQRMEDPPPSMYEVARRLGYPRATLYARFPEYCRSIGQRYRKYRAERWKKHVQGICEQVREAAYSLYIQGYYPKENDVKKMITTRGAFKMPEVREVWKEILRDLGGKS
jgi:transcriptional regulator with XRE-family HTH domain